MRVFQGVGVGSRPGLPGSPSNVPTRRTESLYTPVMTHPNPRRSLTVSNEIQPALLSRREAASYLGYSAQTLRRWADRGAGPIFAKLGTRAQSSIRYVVADLDSWMAAGCPVDPRDRPAASAWGAPSRSRGADGRFVAELKSTGDAS